MRGGDGSLVTSRNGHDCARSADPARCYWRRLTYHGVATTASLAVGKAHRSRLPREPGHVEDARGLADHDGARRRRHVPTTGSEGADHESAELLSRVDCGGATNQHRAMAAHRHMEAVFSRVGGGGFAGSISWFALGVALRDSYATASTGTGSHRTSRRRRNARPTVWCRANVEASYRDAETGRECLVDLLDRRLDRLVIHEQRRAIRAPIPPVDTV